MLILSRKVGESIQIGDDILIRVVRNEGGEVKIGIEAPRHIQIVRDDANVREPRRDRD